MVCAGSEHREHLATCSCTCYVFVDMAELSNWSVDDVEHQSVDRGQWSLHDRQTARSSGCLLHPTDDDDDDDDDEDDNHSAAVSTCLHRRRASGAYAGSLCSQC